MTYIPLYLEGQGYIASRVAIRIHVIFPTRALYVLVTLQVAAISRLHEGFVIYLPRV